MEAAACTCDFEYDEIAALHREKVVTARKEHTCLECGEKIRPGEKYHYYFQVSESGDWWQGHVCTPCERIRTNFCAPFGMLREMIYEYLEFDYVTGEYR
jgi:hypothetical protein